MTVANLNFINQSNDANNTQVVIFQSNGSPASYGQTSRATARETEVAWRVLNCPPGNTHGFTFTSGLQLAASESFGNETPLQNAAPGQLFAMQPGPSGDVLQAAGRTNDPNTIGLVNKLQLGAIDAFLYRDGRRLAMEAGLAPGQSAFFVFDSTIKIVIIPGSEMQEGELVDSAIASQAVAQFNLQGVASADIVLRGCGSGTDASPYRVTLENVRKS